MSFAVSDAVERGGGERPQTESGRGLVRIIIYFGISVSQGCIMCDLYLIGNILKSRRNYMRVTKHIV